MATSSSSQQPNPAPTPNPAPKPGSDNSKQRIIAIAAVVIIALLGVNIFLLVNKAKQTRLNEGLTAQLDESEQLKAELEKQYYEALSELEGMRGSNEELNALIEKQKEDLKSQKDQIETLLRDSRNLAAARQKIKELNAQVEQYLAEINQLRSENEQLAAQNSELSEVKDSLNSELSTQLANNQELSTAQAALVSEKQQLEARASDLSYKVNMASVIKVDEFDINGLKIRNNDKRAKKRFAKNIDELEVCFNTTANEVAEPGVEEFFVRIVNPLGETLAIENLGSGTLVNQASGEQVRYTQVKEVDYNRQASTLCMVWAPNQPFQEGEYVIEVYNKGHLAGSSTFELK